MEEDFMGWEQTSVSRCFQLLIVYCGGAEHTVRGVLQSSWRLADRRASGTRESGGGLENGSGEVKKSSRKADCLDGRHQSKFWKHRVMRKVTKSRFPPLLFCPLPSSPSPFFVCLFFVFQAVKCCRTESPEQRRVRHLASSDFTFASV